MTDENKQRLMKAIHYKDVTETPVPVCYEWGLQNVNGAWYNLLREYHHTNDDIERAKSWLRNNQDVVSMRVERLYP